MRRLLWLLALILGGSLRLAAGEPLNDLVTAPLLNLPLMNTTELEDLFQDAPRHDLPSSRQVQLGGDWKGEDDFSMSLRTAWTENALCFRLDVKDDYGMGSTRKGGEELGGDSFTLVFARRTVGPYRGDEAFSIVLRPQPDRESCGLEVRAAGSVIQNLGQIERKIFRHIDSPNQYTILLKLPTDGWVDMPRLSGWLGFQLLAKDADTRGQVDHSFVLFPSRTALLPSEQNLGRIVFARDYWINCTPQLLVTVGSKLKLNLTYGNLSDQPSEAEVLLTSFDMNTFAELKDLEAPRHKFTIPAHKVAQNEEAIVDLATVPPGLYRLKARLDVIADPGYMELQRTADMVLFPSLIETKGRARTVPVRSLAANKTPESIAEVYRYMAGGGKVLWSAGVYDASFGEFSANVFPAGPLNVEIPRDGADKIPWAFFGGHDSLNGYGEPLLLRFSPTFFHGQEGIKPFIPDIDYLSGDPEAKKRGKSNLLRNDRVVRPLNATTRRLLLIGVIVDNEGEEGFPEIEVKAGYEGPQRPVLRQVLRPVLGGIGSRHVYVLRAWLGGQDYCVSVENVAKFGPKAKLDFMVLLAGAKEPLGYPAGVGTLSFGGSPTADLFGRQLAVSLYFLRSQMVDTAGNGYSSVPGGRYNSFDLGDTGLLMGELANWGCLPEASALLRALPFQPQRLEGPARANLTIGTPATVAGIYEVWRKGNEDRSLIEPIWAGVVQRQMEALTANIAQGNLGLPSAVGSMGGRDGRPLRSSPMCLATLAALSAGTELAMGLQSMETARPWQLSQGELQRAFERRLVAGPGGLTVADTQAGISAPITPNTWVYGLDGSGSPVATDGQDRVFDSPWLFSGLLFYTDFFGFQAEPRLVDQLQSTFNYLYSISPVFQGAVFRRYQLMDSELACSQLWTVMATMLLDDRPHSSEILDSYIRYNYDEFARPSATSPATAAECAISPFTFKERLNADPDRDGSNLGASRDELNVLNGVTALRTARLIAGIDDSSNRQLKLLPRLPLGWNRIEARDWPVAHVHPLGRIAKIDYTYEEVGNRGNRYQLTLKSDQPIRSLRLRLGPFEPRIRQVFVTAGERRSSVPTVRAGISNWAVVDFDDVSNLRVSAEAEQ